MEYNLYYLDGCSVSTTINDKEIADMPDNEIETILKPVLEDYVRKTSNTSILQNLFISMMTDIGEHRDLGQCEECGSYNDEYTAVVEI